MLIALGCVTLVTLATLAFAHAQQRSHTEAQAQWALERRELLERIQRPERIPTLDTKPAFDVPDQPPSDWAQVGQVASISDSYGIGEDG